MFTGIIACRGEIKGLSATASGRRLAIETGGLGEPPKIGASIAVNGVCLTVVSLAGAVAEFDAVSETLARTTLGELRVGSVVNLEPAVRAGDRMDGHYVLGHIDTTCRLVGIRPENPGMRLILAVEDRAALRCIVPKGSVALDGISLTVAAVTADGFELAIIPETLRVTTLNDRRVGDRMNLETDVLVKAVVRQLDFSAGGGDDRLMSLLKASGF